MFHEKFSSNLIFQKQRAHEANNEYSKYLTNWIKPQSSPLTRESKVQTILFTFDIFAILQSM